MPSKRTIIQSSKRNTASKSRTHARSKVELLSSKTVFQGRIFSVASDRVKEPGGIVVQRDIVRHGGSVVILAVDDSGPEPQVLLERQYRYAADQVLWELPAGSIDRGESPLAGAKRELLEETGYRAKKWSHALHYYPSPGFVDETMTIYLARGLTPGLAHPEEDEFIACHLVPLSRALEMILSGTICDGKTVAGVLWLTEYLRRQLGSL